MSDLERFANPFDWIAELLLTGTSVAIKQLPVSNGFSDENRLKNPTLKSTRGRNTFGDHCGYPTGFTI